MNFKRIIFFFFLVYCLLFIVHFAYSKTIDLYFFYGKGCPYSAKIFQALPEIQKDFPQLEVNTFEVWLHPSNQKLLEALSQGYKIKPEWVPVVFVGDLAIEGAGPNQILQIREEVRRCSLAGCSSPIEKVEVSENKIQLNWKNISIFVSLIIFIILFLISLFGLLKKKK